MKTAIVTGAAGGIGSAVVRRLERDGATVVGVDIVDGIDVTNESHVDDLVARVVRDHGGVDILVNNAGGAPAGATWAPVAETPLADWNAFLALNLTGAFLCSRAVLPSMHSRGRGHIVCVGSISGTYGQRGGAGYAAAKAAIGALVASIAKENAHVGVSCNGIVPGNAPFPTRPAERQRELDALTHLGRVGTHDEFAAAIAFLCSEESSYLSGAMLPVDGGFHRFNVL